MTCRHFRIQPRRYLRNPWVAPRSPPSPKIRTRSRGTSPGACSVRANALKFRHIKSIRRLQQIIRGVIPLALFLGARKSPRYPEEMPPSREAATSVRSRQPHFTLRVPPPSQSGAGRRSSRANRRGEGAAPGRLWTSSTRSLAFSCRNALSRTMAILAVVVALARFLSSNESAGQPPGAAPSRASLRPERGSREEGLSYPPRAPRGGAGAGTRTATARTDALHSWVPRRRGQVLAATQSGVRASSAP